MPESKKKVYFSSQLLEWFKLNIRPLPWKGEKNPYLVWLSEIILQQTRVEQGLQYYENFKSTYPTVEDLAKAPEDEVMKLWQGLGYYSRARNLHATAKFVATELKGVFPNTYKEILTLKGIGPYTAAAIASFAFNLPHAVLDGNVYRVLSRYFGIETPIDSSEGKKIFSQLAQELLIVEQPGKYNQAIMDFGATQCTPKNPGCKVCPMALNCQALKSKKVKELPIKSKRIKKRTRFFNYLVFDLGEHTLIYKRYKKDIWQNLYEYPLIETNKLCEDFEQLKELDIFKKEKIKDLQLIAVSKVFKQVLTHQKIIARFWKLKAEGELELNNSSFLKVEKQNLPNFAFPKLMDLYLNDKSLTLELL